MSERSTVAHLLLILNTCSVCPLPDSARKNQDRVDRWRVTDCSRGIDRSLHIRTAASKPIYENALPLGFLTPGHWTAALAVSSDNYWGFEGTLGFTISEHRGLQHDGVMQSIFSPASRRKTP